MRAMIELLENYDEKSWGLPSYKTAGSSGFDLRCAAREGILLQPFMSEMPEWEKDSNEGAIPVRIDGRHGVSFGQEAIPTGIKIALPFKTEMQIRPRSGISLNFGLAILNSPGTIDSDYRGEIKIIVRNMLPWPLEIPYGIRIAQGVICPVIQPSFIKTRFLKMTERGDNGFGSTGTE